MLTLEQARANRFMPDWDNYVVPVPWFIGRRTVEPRLEALRPFIDWTLLSALSDNARTLLDRVVREDRIRARGVYGFWPANSVGDDIVVYRDDSRRTAIARLHMLRQQEPVADGTPQLSLADFVAPKETLVPDYIGAFAVTAAIGAGDVAGELTRAHGDDSAVIVSALANRIAEACAEYLHAQARQDWGYEKEGAVSIEDLRAGRFRGIRPAFGSPACPDHTETRALLALLDAPAIGITLTDTGAMLPAASVSGVYLAHPDARYFSVGRIGADQEADYASRKAG